MAKKIKTPNVDVTNYDSEAEKIAQLQARIDAEKAKLEASNAGSEGTPSVSKEPELTFEDVIKQAQAKLTGTLLTATESEVPVSDTQEAFAPPAFMQNDATVTQAAKVYSEESEADTSPYTIPDWSKVAKSTTAPLTGEEAAAKATEDAAKQAKAEAASKAASAIRNHSLDIAQYNKDVAAFGKAYGSGANSLPALALHTMEAARILPEVNTAQAEQIFARFSEASAKSANIEYKRGGSFKVQVSKFRQFLEASKHPNVDAYSMMNRAVDIIKDLAASDESPLQGSAYENMVKVARKQKEQDQRELTDEEIKDAVVIEEKREKTPLEKLGDLLKAAQKAHDYAPNAAKPGIEDAAHAIEDAIALAIAAVPNVPAPSEQDESE